MKLYKKSIVVLLVFSLLMCSCSSYNTQSNTDMISAFTSLKETPWVDEDGRLLFYRPTIEFEEVHPEAQWKKISVSGMDPDVYVSSETLETTSVELISQIGSVYIWENDIYYIKCGGRGLYDENPVFEIWSYNIPRNLETKLFSADDIMELLELKDSNKPISSPNMDVGPDGVNVNTPMSFHGIYGEKLILSVGYESHLCCYDLKTEELSFLYLFEDDMAYQFKFGIAFYDNSLYFEEYCNEAGKENRIRIIRYDFSTQRSSVVDTGDWDYYPFLYDGELCHMAFDAEDPGSKSYGMNNKELFEMPSMSFNQLSASGNSLAALVFLSEKTLDMLNQRAGMDAMEHEPYEDVIAARGIAIIKDGAYYPLISDIGRTTLSSVSTDGTNVYWGIGAGSPYYEGSAMIPVCYYDGTLDRIVLIERLGGYQETWNIIASDQYMVVAVNDGFFVWNRG